MVGAPSTRLISVFHSDEKAVTMIIIVRTLARVPCIFIAHDRSRMCDALLVGLTIAERNCDALPLQENCESIIWHTFAKRPFTTRLLRITSSQFLGVGARCEEGECAQNGKWMQCHGKATRREIRLE